MEISQCVHIRNFVALCELAFTANWDKCFKVQQKEIKLEEHFSTMLKGKSDSWVAESVVVIGRFWWCSESYKWRVHVSGRTTCYVRYFQEGRG